MNIIRVLILAGAAVLAGVFFTNMSSTDAKAGAPAATNVEQGETPVKAASTVEVPAEAPAAAVEVTNEAPSDVTAADVKSDEMVFEAQALTGEVVNIGDQIGQGKWSLVMFWQVDCSVCRQQEPIISEFHEKNKDGNAHVIGITIDGMENIDSINNFLASRELSYPNYVGDLGMMAFNYEVIAQRGFRGTPTYLLFNPAGELMGDNPGPVRMEALENFIASRS